MQTITFDNTDVRAVAMEPQDFITACPPEYIHCPNDNKQRQSDLMQQGMRGAANFAEALHGLDDAGLIKLNRYFDQVMDAYRINDNFN